MPKLDFAIAANLLAYDAETGVVTRRVSLSNSTKIGDVAGSPTKKGYIAISVAGEKHLAHRLAWLLHTGAWPQGQIDHKDGVRTNNAIQNLRDVSNRTNSENRKTPCNSSGLLGVSWMTNARKWRAQICVKGAVIYLGLFVDKHAAYAAYLAAKKQLHVGHVIVSH